MSVYRQIKLGLVTTTLRLCLGFYFFAGGIASLYLALNTSTQLNFIQSLIGSMGVINRFINQLFLNWLSPWALIMICASASTIIGLALLTGIFTRLVCSAGICALMLQWFALPVLTIPHTFIPSPCYTIPASLILSLQLGCIGFLICQCRLGPGPIALDRYLGFDKKPTNLTSAILWLRLGISYPLLVGALFGWHLQVPNFDVSPWLLLTLFITLYLPWQPFRRLAGGLLTLVVVWWMSHLVTPELGFWHNLLSIKITFVYFFIGLILTHVTQTPGSISSLQSNSLPTRVV